LSVVDNLHFPEFRQKADSSGPSALRNDQVGRDYWSSVGVGSFLILTEQNPSRLRTAY
jgi:hypothetical protein